MEPYEEYQQQVIQDIKGCIDERGCRPILFVGTGMSMRYFGAPSWKGLLDGLVGKCPKLPRPLNYYLQEHSFEKCAQIIAGSYREWAWENRAAWPEELFLEGVSAQAYVKHQTAEDIKLITPENLVEIDKEHCNEIDLLKKIQPHALITTNFDQLLELLFPEYRIIIGERILRAHQDMWGDIYKIHGCVSESSSLVLTEDDYAFFAERQKYLSAKLLTFFAEHPIVFIGYSVSDSNIKNILADIKPLITDQDGIVSNIFYVSYNPDVGPLAKPSRDCLISLHEGEHIRVKYVEAKDYDWIYEALSHQGPLKELPVRVLRAFMARIKDVVVRRIPSQQIDVSYDTLKAITDDEEILTHIVGVDLVDKVKRLKNRHTLSLKTIANNLGYGHWQPVKVLLKKIEEDTGVNLQASDNIYHRRDVAYKMSTSRWSKEALELFEKVKAGEEYKLDL